MNSKKTLVLNHRDDALEEFVKVSDVFIGASEANDLDVMRKALKNMSKIAGYLVQDTRNRRKKVMVPTGGLN
jgi:hypothetical protein